MSSVWITGAEGFIGTFLATQCAEAGHSVLGTGIKDPSDSWPGMWYEHCDIRDAARTLELLSRFRPDRIFHLAAQSYPTVSLVQPRETMDVNVGGTVNLFECVRESGILPVIVVACSSAEYGPVDAVNLPVNETHPLRPLHPYGVSKVGQDLLAAQYFANYAIPSVRIRIFNTTGPGKVGDVCSDLTKRIVEIEMGMLPFLRVGSLTTRRAILDVRDMVRALMISADSCEAGDVYNVGATSIYSIKELIEAIRSQARVPFRVEQDPSLMRACDEPVIAGNITKFNQSTGWRPEIGLEQTIQDMLEWWRSRLVQPGHSNRILSEAKQLSVSAAKYYDH